MWDIYLMFIVELSVYGILLSVSDKLFMKQNITENAFSYLKIWSTLQENHSYVARIYPCHVAFQACNNTLPYACMEEFFYILYNFTILLIMSTVGPAKILFSLQIYRIRFNYNYHAIDELNVIAKHPCDKLDISAWYVQLLH